MQPTVNGLGFQEIQCVRRVWNLGFRVWRGLHDSAMDSRPLQRHTMSGREVPKGAYDALKGPPARKETGCKSLLNPKVLLNPKGPSVCSPFKDTWGVMVGTAALPGENAPSSQL